ncbi:MAG: riboflavin biosynthesis protein RibF [Clostridia bacterium]|nr:riboflavin biosynthesis protein RibF [Clostridia bacterium]
MSVIEKCISVSEKKNLAPAVMLFERHPLYDISGKAPDALLTQTQRNEILSSLGVKIIRVSFPEIRSMAAEQFVKAILIKNGAEAVCCGFNYRFARDRQGDPDTLKAICTEYGIEAFVLDAYMLDGAVVSSTAIRAALKSGETERANEMLGRPFGYTLPVVHGDRRGTGMGFPTANQIFPDGLIVPKYGVYASMAQVNGKAYPSVTNIGIRPTVGSNVLLSETNIIGFSENIYGQDITVRLLSYLRGETTFPDFEALSRQIADDAAQALKIYDEGIGEKIGRNKKE